MIVWSVVSLIALLGGIGLLFGAFGRWDFLGWRGREQATLSFRAPGDVALTPAQRACAWFFLVMALLFLIQTLVGAASQHYRSELGNFFGIDLAQLLPFNLARTFHVQLALFFVSTSFLAAGIFLTPMIAGREPKRQHWLAYGLLAALAVVVFGSLIGEFGSVHGWFGSDGSVFGTQGFEYLDLGRFWQVLLVIGLFFWVALIFRGLRSRLRREHLGNLPWIFFFAALAIPAFYAVGLLARSEESFTVADFWRFWVVHLWVEDFLELFTTVMVAYVFVLLGVVRERVALTVVFLDILLYSAGGVVGTMHHVYFSGEPAEHMALGAVFSAAEVIPLTFLTVEAWSFLQLGARTEARIDRTIAFWRRWLARARIPDHVLRPPLERSALTIKGLTYMPTGATVAALTTSLPETPGGERNWDYRYTWMRDTTFTLQALHYLNLDWEADEFMQFVADLEPQRGRRTADHVRHRWPARPDRVDARRAVRLRGRAACAARQRRVRPASERVYGAVLDSVLLHTRRSQHFPGGCGRSCSPRRRAPTQHGASQTRGSGRPGASHSTTSRPSSWGGWRWTAPRSSPGSVGRGRSEEWAEAAEEIRADIPQHGWSDRVSCASTTTPTRWTPQPCSPRSSGSCPAATSG